MLAVLAALSTMQTPATPPHRYRVEVKTLNEIDQTSIGKGKVTDGLVTSAIISVTLTDTTGGQIARVMVDSMALSPTGAVAEQLRQHPNAARDARGASIRVYVARGRIQGPPQLSDSTNPALSAILQVVPVLFTGVRSGAKVGDSWADTSHINNSSGARRQSGEVVAGWKVVGAEGDALVLEGTSISRTKTEDPTTGQTMTLSGGSKERVVIPARGPVLRATIETANDLTITAPQLSNPIPGKTSGSLTLTPLP